MRRRVCPDSEIGRFGVGRIFLVGGVNPPPLPPKIPDAASDVGAGRVPITAGLVGEETLEATVVVAVATEAFGVVVDVAVIVVAAAAAADGAGLIIVVGRTRATAVRGFDKICSWDSFCFCNATSSDCRRLPIVSNSIVLDIVAVVVFCSPPLSSSPSSSSLLVVVVSVVYLFLLLLLLF